MMKMYGKMSVFAMLIFILGSCQSENTREEAAAFDRGKLMAQASQQLIVPAYQQMLAASKRLRQAAEALQQSPTAESLQKAKEAWKAAKLQWKSTEVFTFGPIEDSLLTNSIDYWPCSPSGIEEAIEGFEGQADYLSSQGSNRKGLAALEYLLFAEDSEATLSKLGQENRRGYLQHLAQQLQRDLQTIVDAWTSSYQARFAQDASNSAGASTTLLANGMLALIDNMKQFKVGYPAGITTMSDPIPQQVEAYHSGISKECLLRNLTALKQTFTGAGGLGFDDYLQQINASPEKPLQEQIIGSFERCEASLSALHSPLSQAIREQGPAVKEFHGHLEQLQRLLKADMMSQLGLIVVFGDSDGD